MGAGKKPFWSDDEKRDICELTQVEGVSVAQVARRYAVNANLIHKWLRDPRFSPADEESPDIIDGSFLPVEVNQPLPMECQGLATIKQAEDTEIRIAYFDGLFPKVFVINHKKLTII